VVDDDSAQEQRRHLLDLARKGVAGESKSTVAMGALQYGKDDAIHQEGTGLRPKSSDRSSKTPPIASDRPQWTNQEGQIRFIQQGTPEVTGPCALRSTASASFCRDCQQACPVASLHHLPRKLLLLRSAVVDSLLGERRRPCFLRQPLLPNR
jgi:hypothetical protein